jgi:hypothetical protein
MSGGCPGYLRFLEDTGRIYRRVEPSCTAALPLRRCLTPLTGLDKGATPARILLGFRANAISRATSYVTPFTFEAMFIGVSPYQSPAFYA